MFNAITKLFSRVDPDWAKFRQEAENKCLLTPDLSELQQYKRIPVFVYNELQNGQPQNIRLKDCEYGGYGYTESSDFVMYKKLLGKETFPFAMPISEDQKTGTASPSPTSYLGDPGQIMGEIYRLTPQQVVEIDNYMLNTVYYERRRTDILVPVRANDSDEFKIMKVNAFIHVGKSEFWNDQIFSGEGKKLFARSKRIFNVKDKNNEPLSAYYTFDYNVEAGK